MPKLINMVSIFSRTNTAVLLLALALLWGPVRLSQLDQGTKVEIYQIQEKVKALTRSIDLRLHSLKERLATLRHRETNEQVQQSIDLYDGIENRIAAIEQKTKELEERRQVVSFSFEEEIDQFKLDQMKTILFKAESDTDSEKTDIENLLKEDDSVRLPTPEDETSLTDDQNNPNEQSETEERSSEDDSINNEASKEQISSSVKPTTDEDSISDNQKEQKPAESGQETNVQTSEEKVKLGIINEMKEKLNPSFEKTNERIDPFTAEREKSQALKIKESEAFEDYAKDELQEKIEERRIIDEIEQERKKLQAIQFEVKEQLKKYTDTVNEVTLAINQETQDKINELSQTTYPSSVQPEKKRVSKSSSIETDKINIDDLYKQRSVLAVEIVALQNKLAEKKKMKDEFLGQLKEIKDDLEKIEMSYLLGDTGNISKPSQTSRSYLLSSHRSDVDSIVTGGSDVSQLILTIKALSEKIEKVTEEIKSIELILAEKTIEFRILNSDIEEYELQNLYETKSKLSLENVELETKRREKVYQAIQELEKKRDEIVKRERQQLGAIESQDNILIEQEQIRRQKLEEELLKPSEPNKVKANLFNIFDLKAPKEFEEVELLAKPFEDENRRYLEVWQETRHPLIHMLQSFANDRTNSKQAQNFGKNLLHMLTIVLTDSESGHAEFTCESVNSTDYFRFIKNVSKLQANPKSLLVFSRQLINDSVPHERRYLEEKQPLLSFPPEVQKQILSDLEAIPECIQNKQVQALSEKILNSLEKIILDLKYAESSSALAQIIQLIRPLLIESTKVTAENYTELLDKSVATTKTILEDLLTQSNIQTTTADIVFAISVIKNLQEKLRTKYAIKGQIGTEVNLLVNTLKVKLIQLEEEGLKLYNLSSEDLTHIRNRLVDRISAEAKEVDGSKVAEIVAEFEKSFSQAVQSKLGFSASIVFSKELFINILNDLLKNLERMKDPLKKSNFVYDTADIESLVEQKINELRDLSLSVFKKELLAFKSLVKTFRIHLSAIQVPKLEADRLIDSVNETLDDYYEQILGSIGKTANSSDDIVTETSLDLGAKFKEMIDELEIINQNLAELSSKLNIKAYLNKFLEREQEDSVSSIRLLQKLSDSYTRHSHKMTSMESLLYELCFVFTSNLRYQGFEKTNKQIHDLLKGLKQSTIIGRKLSKMSYKKGHVLIVPVVDFSFETVGSQTTLNTESHIKRLWWLSNRI